MLFTTVMLTALAAQEAPLPRITPGQVVEASHGAEWRAIDPDLLLVMDLEGDRRVLIELNRTFAPAHVANIQRFARAAHWADANVYRVQDNYVAQWGIRDDDKASPAGVVEQPPAEYVRSVEGLSVTGLGYPDPYAQAAGFVDGWPVALYKDGTASLTHCYGHVGVARDYAPATGSGSELYAIIGHAPRHLDRNIAIVGRVIEGIEHLSSLPRGTETLGMYPEGQIAAPIERIVLASMLPPAERPDYEVLMETSDSFARYLSVRANRNDDFYRTAAGGVALCNVQVPVREAKRD